MNSNEDIFDRQEEILFWYKASDHDSQNDLLLGQTKILMVDKSGCCDNIPEKDLSTVAGTVKKIFTLPYRSRN